jgi:3-oxoacyl-(acyl-carrier-protein) synthase/pyruvate/2-oxoglutarate dehydrogenase complex dihydrolipoamide acyltransferase (E2) component/acyl carrier protein
MTFDVIVPQLGEGLQEVRIVRLFKRTDDTVGRDEPLLEMETDKALVQVESACGGRLMHWLVQEGDIVPVGAIVAQIETTAESTAVAMTTASESREEHGTGAAVGSPRIPPRTRAYGRQLGITPEVLATIPARTSRVLPADVDRWRSAQSAAPLASAQSVVRPLSTQQRALNHRFKRSAEQVVAATLRRTLPWLLIETRLGQLRAHSPETALSPLVVLAHAAAQAAHAHPRFRSAIAGDDSLREHHHVTIGIAVERPDDDLVTAVIEDADALDAGALAETMRQRIARALGGEDQSAGAPNLLLTDLAGHGIVDAVPVLVAPAAAVLFIGAPFGEDGALRFNLVLTFDHRLTNGAGAARFLDTIVERLADGERAEVVPSRAIADSLAVRVRDRVAQLLGVTQPETLDPRRPLRAYGLTSLVAVEVARCLEEDLGLPLPVTLVWNHPTLDAIVRHVTEQMNVAAGEEKHGSTTTTADTRRRVTRAAPSVATGREPIAIVGLGCRFPGADGPAAFWRLMAEGRDAIRDVPRERWDIDTVYDPTPGARGRMITRAGGFLDDVDQFDPSFFGISQREAAGMDPQQRLLLEVAWEALEHAGIPAHGLAGSETGIFVGNCFNDYFTLLAQAPARGGAGTLTSILANRVSYFLDLRGPSLVIDTACSSSLVAIDLACRSLRDGTSSLALAGGVNLILSPRMHLTFSQAGMMAPDGRCKTFDARADGYGRGDGCGLVVLKRLSDAQAAGDRVLAIIRGTAVNQDGATNGIAAPNGLAQQAVIRRALADAGVDAAAISLVEAHGTGTPLGDSIEVEALRAVYGAPRADEDVCVLGSVKTNVGHLEAAAGVAGLIKLVLCLQHEAIPPHVHFQTPNPHLPLAGTPFVISKTLRAWPRGAQPRVASLSSFGVGGTNAHAILEEAPVTSTVTVPEREGYVLPLSARNDKALAALIDRYRARIDGPSPSLGELCRTAGAGRSHFAVRLAITCRSLEQLRARLAMAATGGEGEGLYRGRRTGHATPRVGFFIPVTPSSEETPQPLIEMWRAFGVEPVALVLADDCADQSPSKESVDLWLTLAAPGAPAIPAIQTRTTAYDGHPWPELLDSAATLYARGVDIDWAAFHPQAGQRAELPTYPFQRRRCWLEPEELLSWRPTEIAR